ncbi:hypothetical protein MODO_3159 [Myroides odoratimimus]|uniref:hypothetical protein n=1 Tax=Myroides odoratimimus TaxID=76832 RepID=UPI0007273F2B|nr:hypothetical protein [Myroides odoratimimus]GAQ15463.1 hypothetical protein MODO_3159 [Myroides odoratimimus]STZ48163.1 Uncharacterised protein [Myroides odoratimimus]
MRKTIIELLEVTPTYYDEIVLHSFVDWCMGFNTTAYSLQQALISKPIQRYFKATYTALEEQFIKEVQGYKGLDASAKNEFYATITNQIFRSYPGALIPKHKKSKQPILNQN